MTLAEKLRPDRFTEMSGTMAAIIGYILGESWTEPDISTLSVTSDGFVTTVEMTTPFGPTVMTRTGPTRLA